MHGSGHAVSSPGQWRHQQAFAVCLAVAAHRPGCCVSTAWGYLPEGCGSPTPWTGAQPPGWIGALPHAGPAIQWQKVRLARRGELTAVSLRILVLPDSKGCSHLPYIGIADNKTSASATAWCFNGLESCTQAPLTYSEHSSRTCLPGCGLDSSDLLPGEAVGVHEGGQVHQEDGDAPEPAAVQADELHPLLEAGRHKGAVQARGDLVDVLCDQDALRVHQHYLHTAAQQSLLAAGCERQGTRLSRCCTAVCADGKICQA